MFCLLKLTAIFDAWRVNLFGRRILLARLEYLRETFQIKEGDFLTFDALVLSTRPFIFLNNYNLLLCLHAITHFVHTFRDKLLNVWDESSDQRQIMG